MRLVKKISGRILGFYDNHLFLATSLFLHDRQNWAVFPDFISLNDVTSVSLHLIWALLGQAEQVMNLWIMANFQIVIGFGQSYFL